MCKTFVSLLSEHARMILCLHSSVNISDFDPLCPKKSYHATCSIIKRRVHIYTYAPSKGMTVERRAMCVETCHILITVNYNQSASVAFVTRLIRKLLFRFLFDPRILKVK